MKTRTLVLAVVAIVVLASAIYLDVAVQSQSSSTTTTSSLSSTTNSSTSTTRTSCTTTTSSTSSSTSTSTSSTSSNVTDGTFTYSPSSPVQIDSVKAMTARGQDGSTRVTFQVVFDNSGSSQIFVLGGCGSGLSASIVGGNSPVIQKVPGGPLCDCAEFLLGLNHGQNHASVTPGCWSGYNYDLVRPGSAIVNLTLLWGTNAQNFQGMNSTSISAKFTFAPS